MGLRIVETKIPLMDVLHLNQKFGELVLDGLAKIRETGGYGEVKAVVKGNKVYVKVEIDIGNCEI